MGPRISDEKLNSIVDQLKQGAKPLAIAQNVECHLATVYRIDRNLKYFDSPRAPPAIRGRPKKITTDILEDIQEYCVNRVANPPGLAELAGYVTAKYGFSISQSSMSRAMKELGLLPKEVCRDISMARASIAGADIGLAWQTQRLAALRTKPKSATGINETYRVHKSYARPDTQIAHETAYHEAFHGVPGNG